MKITDQSGELFQIQPDFEIKIEATNPFLSEQGTFSLPVTLPASPNNLRIIENAERIQRRNKVTKKRKVTIQDGVFFKPATMEIFSAKEDSGIVTSLYLNESELYNKIKGVKLPSIFENIIRNDFSGATNEKVIKWLDHLTKVMIGDIDDDFFIFPVRTKVTEVNRRDYEDLNAASKYTRKILNTESLNFLYTDFPESQTSNLQIYQGKAYYKLFAYKEQVAIDGDTEIKLPLGYGVTPFLKVKVLLKKIFEHYGYDIEFPEDFENNISFQKMCVLNNVADSICKGIINYGHLVPTVLVSDFLDTIKARFNLEIYVVPENMKVVMKLFSETYKNIPDEDYTKYVTGKYLVEFSEGKRIKLTSTSDNEYSNTGYNSYQELLKKYGKISTITKKTSTVEAGCYFVTESGAYYEYKPGSPGGDRGNPGWTFICRPTLNYFDPNSESLEERSAKDVHTVMLYSQFWRQVGDLDKAGGTINIPAPYVGEARHLNTTVKYSNDPSESTSSFEKEESSGECPIMFCFSVGRLFNKPGARDTPFDRFFGGSTLKYRNDGSVWGEFSLMYEDLYKYFYEDYENVLNNSFCPVTVPLKLPAEKIMSLRWDKLKIIDGQPLLPEKLVYTIKNGDIIMDEMKFRTTKIYE